MKKRIAVIGAGPAGLSLAYKLLKRFGDKVEVSIFEKDKGVGGISASFGKHGLYFDYGSHRLHPAIDNALFQDIQTLLGNDLFKVPRNGRIRILDRFVKFPLNLVDASLHLPLRFFGGVLKDTLQKPFRKNVKDTGSFSEVLLAGLGETICRGFYFPYAKKLWGLKPVEIASEQAYKRISSNSVSKIIKKTLTAVFRGRDGGGAYFYYPRTGFGQIFTGYAGAITELGGRIYLETEVIRIDNANFGGIKLAVKRNGADQSEEFDADMAFTTIPITDLVERLNPSVPGNVQEAAAHLKYRGMMFHYLILKTGRFTPYDAHYFPEQKYIFSRISEPKNYYRGKEPDNITGICSEIPYSDGDRISALTHDEITREVISNLNECGLKIDIPVVDSFIIKKPAIYPIYDRNYTLHFKIIDQYLNGINNLITLGRQGLFVHDNVHHVISMGDKAAQCLEDDLSWNTERWRQSRQEFKTHVVVD